MFSIELIDLLMSSPLFIFSFLPKPNIASLGRVFQQTINCLALASLGEKWGLVWVVGFTLRTALVFLFYPLR